MAITFDHPVVADFRWRRVRVGLTTLSRKGVEPWWIVTRTPALLEFTALDEIETKVEGKDDRRPRALVTFLKEIADGFDRPRAKVLTICLALVEEYEDLDGAVHSLLDLGAGKRQTLAGEEFRGKRGRLGQHAIRLTHLPEALDHLAEEMLYREIDITGFWRKGSAEPRKIASHAPGVIVPEPGPYETCDGHGVPTGRIVALQAGEQFPPTLLETFEAAWYLSDAAVA